MFSCTYTVSMIVRITAHLVLTRKNPPRLTFVFIFFSSHRFSDMFFFSSFSLILSIRQFDEKTKTKKGRMCFNFFQRKSIFIKPSVLCVYGCACIRAIMEHQRIQNYIIFFSFCLFFFILL